MQQKKKYFIIEFFSLLYAAKNLLFFCLIAIGGGAVVFQYEGLNKGTIKDWGDCIYASFTTAFTIGYGDLTPSGIYGRVTAILLGIIGMLLVGTVVGASIKALERSR